MINLIQAIGNAQLNLERIKSLFVSPKQVLDYFACSVEDGIRNLVDVTDEEMRHLIEFLDANRDGVVSLSDLKKVLAPDESKVRQSLQSLLEQEVINYNKIQAAKYLIHEEDFRVLEQGRGFITAQSVKGASSLSSEVIEAYFRAIDKDKDGRIYLKDLIKSVVPVQKSYEWSRQRQQQVHLLVQNRLALQKHDAKFIKTLMKVRSQQLQIDFIRRNSMRAQFEKQLKMEFQLLKKQEEQLYSVRTQQDVIRKRELSLHSII